MVRRGIVGALAGWATYGFIIINSYQNQIPIPEGYDWAKQVIALIPIILGHHYLAYRIHRHH